MKKLCLLLFFSLVLGQGYAQSFGKAEIRQSMRQVADWQIAHMKEVPHDPLNWVNATFYLGLTKWAEIAEQENSLPLIFFIFIYHIYHTL